MTEKKNYVSKIMTKTINNTYRKSYVPKIMTKKITIHAGKQNFVSKTMTKQINNTFRKNFVSKISTKKIINALTGCYLNSTLNHVESSYFIMFLITLTGCC